MGDGEIIAISLTNLMLQAPRSQEERSLKTDFLIQKPRKKQSSIVWAQNWSSQSQSCASVSWWIKNEDRATTSLTELKSVFQAGLSSPTMIKNSDWVCFWLVESTLWTRFRWNISLNILWTRERILVREPKRWQVTLFSLHFYVSWGPFLHLTAESKRTPWL